MDETDAELLAATAAGEAEAFGRFYRRHKSRVLGYAIHRCANPSDVADLVAETFIGALRSAARFDNRDGDALPWLLTIARRALFRQRRSFLRRERLGRRLATLPTFCPDEAEAVAGALDASRIAPDLVVALRALASKDQELVVLVHRDGLTPAQAGRVVGMNPNTARLRLSRARARLRDQLAGRDGPPATIPDPEVSHVQP